MSETQTDDLQAEPAPVKVTDPVCGMNVNPATSKHRFDHHDRTYHFCSAGCRTKFVASPEKYLTASALPPPASKPPAITGATYTCPMHPEIHQPRRGQLPDLWDGA